MPERPILNPTKIAQEAVQQITLFHADTVAEVRQAVEQPGITVVGMAQNPFVKKARNALAAAGIAFRYLEYGSYLGEWQKRLAIKLWSGWPTFPQVFIDGVLIGGYTELQKQLAQGSLKRFAKTA